MIKIYRLMSFGLLPIRIIAGIGFIMNGLPKLVNITGTEAEFASKIGLPAALALPVGLLEVIGGVFLIIGVLTRIASILFIILMIGATITVQLSKGFLGRYEINLFVFINSSHPSSDRSRTTIHRVECTKERIVSER
jgi:putative oxidoreductase